MVRKENGITMLSLAVTIVVMIILTFTFTVNVNLYTERKRQTNFETDMLRLKEEIIQYYANNKALPIANKYTNTSHLEKNINDNENYYVINLSLIDVDLNYGKDFYSITDNEQEINDLLNIYIINEQSLTIYFPKGVTYNGEKHYTTNNANVVIEDIELYGLKIEGETVGIIGEEINLTVETIPSFIENTGIIWSSSDEEIATVNENGKVTTLSQGNVTITATSEDNNLINATHTIQVKALLTFDSNNGTGTMKSKKIAVGEEITLPENTFTKENYVFYKWNTQANGEGTFYNDNESINLTQNTTLYAQWLEGYSITYNLNDGTVSDNMTIYTVETETFTLNNPTKDGYIFVGWTGSNGSTPQQTVTIEKGSTGDKNYTANWDQEN